MSRWVTAACPLLRLTYSQTQGRAGYTCVRRDLPAREPGESRRNPACVVVVGRHQEVCRDFVMSMYQELKKANPKLPILVRECEGVTPKLIARYGAHGGSCLRTTTAASAGS